MPREITVSCQTVATVVCHQIDTVSLVKFDVHAATSYEISTLCGGEWVQNQLWVTNQVHTARAIVDGAVELEFIHAWLRTCENPCGCVIRVLSIVDDITEDQGHARFGEVVAKSDGESNFMRRARRSWRSRRSRGARGSARSTWSCMKERNTIRKYNYISGTFLLLYSTVILFQF